MKTCVVESERLHNRRVNCHTEDKRRKRYNNNKVSTWLEFAVFFNVQCPRSPMLYLVYFIMWYCVTVVLCSYGGTVVLAVVLWYGGTVVLWYCGTALLCYEQENKLLTDDSSRLEECLLVLVQYEYCTYLLS